MELLDGLLPDHPGLRDLREGAQQLDQYYIPTRYPNGLPGGTPAEARQATEAITFAQQFIMRTKAEIGAKIGP